MNALPLVDNDGARSDPVIMDTDSATSNRPIAETELLTTRLSPSETEPTRVDDPRTDKASPTYPLDPRLMVYPRASPRTDRVLSTKDEP